MRLSLSGFLFEDNYTSQSLNFLEFCQLARSAGYDGVELRRTQINPRAPKAQRWKMLEVVKENGLRVTCLTARGLPAAGTERNDFCLNYLELCRDMECDLLKIGSDTGWLLWAAELAEKYDVVLATNNHVGGPLETVEGTRTYLAEIAHSNFGLLYDSLHLTLTGQDYISCIPEFFSVTRNILIHSIRPAKPEEKPDIERDGKNWVKALPDEFGVQDWAAIFRSYKKLVYDGLITVIESDWPIERREYVARHCAKVIRDMWKRG